MWYFVSCLLILQSILCSSCETSSCSPVWPAFLRLSLAILKRDCVSAIVVGSGCWYYLAINKLVLGLAPKGQPQCSSACQPIRKRCVSVVLSALNIQLMAKHFLLHLPQQLPSLILMSSFVFILNNVWLILLSNEKQGSNRLPQALNS